MVGEVSASSGDLPGPEVKLPPLRIASCTTGGGGDGFSTPLSVQPAHQQHARFSQLLNLNRSSEISSSGRPGCARQALLHASYLNQEARRPQADFALSQQLITQLGPLRASVSPGEYMCTTYPPVGPSTARARRCGKRPCPGVLLPKVVSTGEGPWTLVTLALCGRVHNPALKATGDPPGLRVRCSQSNDEAFNEPLYWPPSAVPRCSCSSPSASQFTRARRPTPAVGRLGARCRWAS